MAYGTVDRSVILTDQRKIVKSSISFYGKHILIFYNILFLIPLIQCCLKFLCMYFFLQDHLKPKPKFLSKNHINLIFFYKQSVEIIQKSFNKTKLLVYYHLIEFFLYIKLIKDYNNFLLQKNIKMSVIFIR